MGHLHRVLSQAGDLPGSDRAAEGRTMTMRLLGVLLLVASSWLLTRSLHRLRNERHGRGTP